MNIKTGTIVWVRKKRVLSSKSSENVVFKFALSAFFLKSAVVCATWLDFERSETLKFRNEFSPFYKELSCYGRITSASNHKESKKVLLVIFSYPSKSFLSNSCRGAIVSLNRKVVKSIAATANSTAFTSTHEFIKQLSMKINAPGKNSKKCKVGLELSSHKMKLKVTMSKFYGPFSESKISYECNEQPLSNPNPNSPKKNSKMFITGSELMRHRTKHKMLIKLKLISQRLYRAYNKTVSNQKLSLPRKNVDPRRVTEALLMRSGNVESNPGPPPGREPRNANGTTQVQREPEAAIWVTSYNVRGLKEEAKLRHLVNSFHKRMGGKNRDFVACLQETYVENEGRLPYLWRGNFHLTPGTGNSCGCITLVSAHINIIGSKSIGNRAHVLACQKVGDLNTTYIVANVYAPCPNNTEKADFFEELFDSLNEFEDRYNCSRRLIIGDFNTNLKENEMQNRMYSVQEKRIASQIKSYIRDFGLKDCWSSAKGYT